jgi:hypothetical protein
LSGTPAPPPSLSTTVRISQFCSSTRGGKAAKAGEAQCRAKRSHQGWGGSAPLADCQAKQHFRETGAGCTLNETGARPTETAQQAEDGWHNETQQKSAGSQQGLTSYHRCRFSRTGLEN